MSSLQLTVRGLTKGFNGHVVLAGVDLEVSKGEVVAVIGPSGSGKTTLLRCLNLLEHPEAGTMCLGGRTFFRDRMVGGMTLSEVRRRIGMVFQHLYLWPHKSVLGNIIEAPVVTGKLSRGVAVATAQELLDDMRLLHKANEYPANLSGGEQQRVAICRTLIMEPEVILLDEITSALDPEVVGDVLEVMAGVAKKGHTMIVVTHEMVFARDVAQRVLFLDRGRFIEEGSPEQLLTNPRHQRTKEFLARVLYSRQMEARKS